MSLRVVLLTTEHLVMEAMRQEGQNERQQQQNTKRLRGRRVALDCDSDDDSRHIGSLTLAEEVSIRQVR